MVVFISATRWFFYMAVGTVAEDSTALNWRQLKKYQAFPTFYLHPPTLEFRIEGEGRINGEAGKFWRK